MKSVKHYSFTLWVHSDCDRSKVPVLRFDESDSYDCILLTILSLDELGLTCSLTCDTWSDIEDVNVEELVK